MAAVEDVPQRPAVEVLEDEERSVRVLSPVEDLHHVGVAEAGDGAGLGPEAAEERLVLGEGGVQDLDGDATVQLDVVGHVDVGRRASADGSDESVSPPEHAADLVGDARRGHPTRLVADYGFDGHAEQNGGVSRRWVRPVLVTALLGLAAFLLYVGVQAQSEEEPEVRRAGVARVFPEPGVVALRQDAIGAELDFGYTGRLQIDRRDIPDDQVDTIAGINRLSFTPGPEKEIESLDEGRHCVSLIYWRASEGETGDERPYTWCFTAA